MGFLQKLIGQFRPQETHSAAQPDGAAGASSGNSLPDLTAYRKAILLHEITFAEIEALLSEYAQIYSDAKKVECDFCYTALPADEKWIYLEFPNFEDVPHRHNFWNYQNLMIWLTEKADMDFCLAIPRDPNAPLFFSELDRENPYGCVVKGVYADRTFSYDVAQESLTWGAEKAAPFDYVGYLKKSFQFDTQWIPAVSGCKWERTHVTLTVPEN